MKHLLTGVAMAAALAIAAPVWAQNAPMTPPAGGSTPPAAAPAAPAKPAAAAPAKPAAKPMAAKPMHRPMRRHWVRSRDDSMTEQLNQQELARISGGGAPAAPASMAPGGNNPTSGSAGPFAPPPAK